MPHPCNSPFIFSYNSICALSNAFHFRKNFISDYMRIVGSGWWGAMKWLGKRTLSSCTSIMNPLVLEIHSSKISQISRYYKCLEELTVWWALFNNQQRHLQKLGIHGYLTCLKIQPQV